MTQEPEATDDFLAFLKKPEFKARMDKLEAERRIRSSLDERERRKERLRLAEVPLDDHARIAIRDGLLERTRMMAATSKVVNVAKSGYTLCTVLALIGPVGRGKTVAGAFAIAELSGAYIKLERASRIHRCARVMDETEWRSMLRARVLFIDELGLERDPIEGRMALQEIADERQGRGQITIMGTNLSEEELTARFDPRTFDRMRSRWEVEMDTGRSFRERRPWREVLRLEDTELAVDAGRVTDRATALRGFLEERGAPIERLVELSAARYEAMLELKTRAA